MKKAIALIFHDLKEGKNIENYLLILAAIVVGVLNIIGIAKQEVTVTVTLAVLSLIVYGQITNERRLEALKMTNKVIGIKSFNIDRSNLPPLFDLLKTSQEEVAIMGLQLGSIKHNYLQLLEDCAKRGCNIRLLMMSPINKDGMPLPWVEEVGRINTFINLRDTLMNNIAILNNWLNNVHSKQTRSRIDIRFYPSIPTSSTVFIDKDADDGSINVELLLYNFSPSSRPSFTLERYNSPVLYNRLVQSFNDLWQEAIDITDYSKAVRSHVSDSAGELI